MERRERRPILITFGFFLLRLVQNNNVVGARALAATSDDNGAGCTNMAFEFHVPAITIRNNDQSITAAPSTSNNQRQSNHHLPQNVVFAVAFGVSCLVLFTVIGLLLLRLRQRPASRFWAYPIRRAQGRRQKPPELEENRVSRGQGSSQQHTWYNDKSSAHEDGDMVDDILSPHSPEDYWKPAFLNLPPNPQLELPPKALLATPSYGKERRESWEHDAIHESPSPPLSPTKPLTIHKSTPTTPKRPLLPHISPETSPRASPLHDAGNVEDGEQQQQSALHPSVGAPLRRPPPALSIKTTNLTTRVSQEKAEPKTPLREWQSFELLSKAKTTNARHEIPKPRPPDVPPQTTLGSCSCSARKDKEREADLEEALVQVRLVKDEILAKAAEELRGVIEREERLVQRQKTLLVLTGGTV